MNATTIIPDPFSDRLLKWWDENGRQDLPWQHPRTPYRVWVSEVMLQQTQVSTVIPYFERWILRFPDVQALAEAPLDDVLSLWSGLGYYARARNLHRTAIQCCEHHDGQIPLQSGALTSLPGIGLSTANAIISQSTDQPAAVLDGNVRRSFARHLALEGWTGKSSVQKQLWSAAQARLPATRGADYTQAVMDLGALVCTRTKPACNACPVSEDCQAWLNEEVHRYPSPKPATKVTRQSFRMLIIRDKGGRVLLVKRPPVGIWGGLWSLPMGESNEDIESELGVSDTRPISLKPFEHRLSHMHLEIQPALATSLKASHVKCSSSQRWFNPADSGTIGLPRPVSTLLKRMTDGELK